MHGHQRHPPPRNTFTHQSEQQLLDDGHPEGGAADPNVLLFAGRTGRPRPRHVVGAAVFLERLDEADARVPQLPKRLFRAPKIGGCYVREFSRNNSGWAWHPETD